MDVLGYLYAALVSVGGLVGYLKAGSVASLLSGLTTGGLMAYAAKRVSDNPHDVYLALVVTAVLLGVMGSRFYQGGKFMPAGLVAGLSLMMLVRYALVLIK